MVNIQDFFNRERGLRLKVARELNITHGAVSQWKECPANRVVAVARILGVNRSALRPDLYPEEDAA